MLFLCIYLSGVLTEEQMFESLYNSVCIEIEALKKVSNCIGILYALKYLILNHPF